MLVRGDAALARRGAVDVLAVGGDELVPAAGPGARHRLLRGLHDSSHGILPGQTVRLESPRYGRIEDPEPNPRK